MSKEEYEYTAVTDSTHLLLRKAIYDFRDLMLASRNCCRKACSSLTNPVKKRNIVLQLLQCYNLISKLNVYALGKN